MGLRVVFLGPPGAGKGTQAKRYAERVSVPHISTGDMLREAKRSGTPVGERAKEYMDKGRLVPDEVVNDLVRERMAKDDCAKGFALDGYPRTLDQAKVLDAILADLGRPLERTVHVDTPAMEVVERIGGRRSCPKCGAMYHVVHVKPKVAGKCDACGGGLIQRGDDRPEAVEERLRVYERQSAPLVGYYGSKGIMVRVDGMQSPDEIFTSMCEMLGI